MFSCSLLLPTISLTRVGQNNSKENSLFRGCHKLQELMVMSVPLVILKFCTTKNLLKNPLFWETSNT